MTDESTRWRYGLVAVVTAVVAILTAFIFASYMYKSANDVSTSLAAITGTLGTVLGAYLGVQTGSAGKEAADQARTESERKATAFAAVADPAQAMQVMRGLGLLLPDETTDSPTSASEIPQSTLQSPSPRPEPLA